MNSNHFPQAAAGITQSSSKEITTCSLWRRGQGTSPTLHSRAVVGALLSAAVPSPEVFLPGPFVTIPSSGPAVGSALAAYPRWLVAEFEQEVLYERGLAQVGFGVLPLLSLYFLLSKRLTVCLTWFDLVRATAAHRTPTGLIIKRDNALPYPGFGNPGLEDGIPSGFTSLGPRVSATTPEPFQSSAGLHLQKSFFQPRRRLNSQRQVGLLPSVLRRPEKSVAKHGITLLR